MTELDREFFEDYKKLFPNMDLEMISTFAQTMLIFHRLPILMEGYFHKMGLTRGRFMVLIQLYQRQGTGLTIGEICNFHRVRSATMTGIIDTLEREGQIERVQDPSDRRKVIVRITEAGRELMEAFLPQHQENVGQMLSGLTVKERRGLLRLLEKLHQGVLNFVTDDHGRETEGGE
jgi:DNA-binding MarR family transcriptional regulator